MRKKFSWRWERVLRCIFGNWWKITNLHPIHTRSQVADRLLTSCFKWFRWVYRAVTWRLWKGLVFVKHMHDWLNCFAHKHITKAKKWNSLICKQKGQYRPRSGGYADVIFSRMILRIRGPLASYCCGWYPPHLSKCHFSTFLRQSGNLGSLKSTVNNYLTAGVGANCGDNFVSQKMN